jgi:hypothetical protein
MPGVGYGKRQLNPFYRELCGVFGFAPSYADKSGNTGRRRYKWVCPAYGVQKHLDRITSYNKARELCRSYGVDEKCDLLDWDGIGHVDNTEYVAYFDPDCPHLWAKVLAREVGLSDDVPFYLLADKLDEEHYDPKVVARFRTLAGVTDGSGLRG